MEKVKIVVPTVTVMQLLMMSQHMFWSVLACTLSELHAVKVLFYAESVGVVTLSKKDC